MLWARFLLMLRTAEPVSNAIRMVFLSFNKILPFIVIFVLSTTCFANVVIVLLAQSKKDNESDDADAEADADKDDDENSFVKWMREYWNVWSELFVDATGSTTVEQLANLQATFTILLFLFIILNILVVSNLLLAVVVAVQKEVSSLHKENYYRELTNQMYFLQKIFIKTEQAKDSALFLAMERQQQAMYDDDL